MQDFVRFFANHLVFVEETIVVIECNLALPITKDEIPA